MMSNMQIKSYTWEDLVKLTASISNEIIRSGYRTDVIIGILRGGSFPALLLSHNLNLRDLYLICISTTNSEDIRASRHTPIIKGCSLDCKLISDKNIVVIDDVVNTGKTIDECCKYIKTLGASQIKTACLVRDTYSDTKDDNSTYVVDFIGDTIPCWAKFPWEIDK